MDLEIEEPDLDYLVHEELPEFFDLEVAYLEQDELVSSENADVLAIFNISKCLGIAAVNPSEGRGFISHSGSLDMDEEGHRHVQDLRDEIKDPERYSAYLVVGNDTPERLLHRTYDQMSDYFGENSVEVWRTDPGEQVKRESSLAVHVDSGICLRYEPSERILERSSFPSR